MNKKHLLTVEYACDSNGDHTAPMSECIDSDIKDFNTKKEQYLFVTECTYVYNLAQVLGSPKLGRNIFPNPIIHCLQERRV